MLLISLSAFADNESPHGPNFKMDCVNCHSSDSWELLKKNMTFDHSQTGFVLSGQHKTVDCKSCHQTLVFSEAKSECISCHTDMHNNTLGPDCNRCHTPESWIVTNAIIMHQQSRFPLMGTHQTIDCFECHTSATNLQFEPLGVECVDCHLQDFQATTSPNHVESGYSTNCTECHSATALDWTSSNIDHSFFPLNGGHAISCAQCHTSGTFGKISNECISCHQTNYNSTQNPNHQSLGFSVNCSECHTLDPGWRPAEFRDHDAQFFPIYSGTHNGEWNSCSECHTNSSSYAEFSCITCHEHNQSSTDEEHSGVSGYSYKSNLCFACHPAGNTSGAFNHSSTGFPLTGAHTTVDCNSCHTDGFSGLSSDCSSCHLTDFNQTTNPNHQNIGLATSCDQCHTTQAGWKPASFPVHDEYYALTGAHVSIANECATCHNGDYTTTQNTCFACHTNDYNGTTEPDHQASQFPTECMTCHTTTAWQPSSFDHNTTGFALTGAHTTTSCADCHQGNYTNTPNTCYECHSDNYNSTTDPNHAASNFSTDCTQCHSTTNWESSSFDHSTTGFALTGAHTTTSCADCHQGDYTNTQNTCYACHSTNYNNTTDPNHVASGFPTDCQTCHSTTNWESSSFDHSTTGFALTGAHTTTTCVSCHNGNYTNTPNTCYACHETNYTGTTDPNHSSVGFSTDCQTCHSTNDWQSATFDHSTTGFALTGAHTTTSCISCHNGNYTSTPNTCYACHETNYTNTTDPNHSSAGFSTDCQTCHSTTNWEGATFDHSTTGFALTGAHTTTSCVACHDGNYTTTPNTCYACHSADYNNTTDPNHAAAGFPTGCEDCHSTSAWQPSTFNHDSQYFPIYSGRHAGTWNSCASCHITSSNFADFSCITCHEHNKTDTDSHHREVGNYVYSATSCYSCHPTGRAED